MAASAIHGLARVCTWLAAAAIVLMMLGTCWDIFARQAFNTPLHGVVELVEITVLAAVMLGLPEVFLREEQIQVDLVDTLSGPRVLAVLRALALGLSASLLALMAWVVWQPMLDARLFGDMKYQLGVRVWVLYALILFALLVSVLTTVWRMWAVLSGRSGGEA